MREAAAPQFAHACGNDMSPWWVLIFCTDSALETILHESVCLTSAKMACRLAKLSSVVCGQREAGRSDSTRIQGAAWWSRVTRCSWLVISFLVLWCSELLQESSFQPYIPAFCCMVLVRGELS